MIYAMQTLKQDYLHACLQPLDPRIKKGLPQCDGMLSGLKSACVHAGGSALNPATGAEVPVWVADYVLGSYGSGAIMAVPAHDTRDFEFAQAFGLPVQQVVEADDGHTELPFPGLLLFTSHTHTHTPQLPTPPIPFKPAKRL